ncbi:helix-turn-helix domain-containing protein [Asticcacaulis sp. YBE204]|uniref:helix-turn-helix domain-containing protein n=1 Tax=Asticcacaulis sp. YBE204 TaxID=1282363 RepID=UPI0005550B68|nr:helix-turn-helix transcriptional regulator [Asticcacaulis sp. YBE204]
MLSAPAIHHSQHTGSPNAVDIHVGACVRARRKALGFSQEYLAEQIGLTFQQIQKYEKGTNRISASKLFDIATALKVPIVYFFEGCGQSQGVYADFSPSETSIQKFLKSPEGLTLAKFFPEIRSASQRRRLVALVRTLADGV